MTRRGSYLGGSTVFGTGSDWFSYGRKEEQAFLSSEEIERIRRHKQERTTEARMEKAVRDENKKLAKACKGRKRRGRKRNKKAEEVKDLVVVRVGTSRPKGKEVVKRGRRSFRTVCE